MFSELALFIHIGTSNKFDAQVESELLRSQDLVRDQVGHTLQVELIAVHDDGSVAAVETMGHLLAVGLYGTLDECLLRVDVKRTIFVSGVLREFDDALVVPLDLREVSLSDVAKHPLEVFLQSSGLSVDREQVTVRVPGHAVHVWAVTLDSIHQSNEVLLCEFNI